MKTSLRDTEKTQALKEKLEKIAQAREAIAKSNAASLLGKLGGMSGTGDAKRRPSDVCRAAVNKRWEAYRKQKMSRRKIKAD
jgi:hypothetical protein